MVVLCYVCQRVYQLEHDLYSHRHIIIEIKKFKLTAMLPLNYLGVLQV
jgi:hypothetical protein